MEQRILGRTGRQNSHVPTLPPLDQRSLDAIEDLYDKYFRAQIHSRW